MSSNAYSHYDFGNEIPDPEDYNEESGEVEEGKISSREIIE